MGLGILKIEVGVDLYVVTGSAVLLLKAANVQGNRPSD